MKILIVDDSLLDRKLITTALKRAGITAEILEAVDGEEGFKLLSAHYKDIGLILLDWQMPKLDGIEFMRGTVKVPEVKDIPIIMTTASGSEDNKRHAKEVNPQLAGYIVKPFKPETLLEAVKKYIT